MGGKQGDDTKKLATKVYKSLKGKIDTYLDDNEDEVRKITNLVPSREGAASFLAAVFANHIVNEGVPELVIGTDISFKDILGDEGTISGLYQGFKDTVLEIAPNFSVNRSWIGGKKLVSENGKVTGFFDSNGQPHLNQENQPSELKMRRAMTMISNSSNTELGFWNASLPRFWREESVAGKFEVSPELKKVLFSTFLYAHPEEAVNLRQMKLRFISGNFFYETGGGG